MKLDKKKKFRIGFEFGARGRQDYCSVSYKKDIKTKFKDLLKKGNYIKISQAELSDAINAITTEIPNLQAVIEGLTAPERQYLGQLVGNITQKSFLALMQWHSVTKDDIKESMGKICNFLGINEHAQANAWAIFHDPKYLDTLFVFVTNPELLKADVTIDELNQVRQSFIETMGNIIDVALKKNNLDSSFNSKFVSTDYVNWDLFANFFVNYNLTDKIYLVAGIGFNYNLEKKKGHSLCDRNHEGASKNRFIDADCEFNFYHTKYAITPRIGWGRQFTKRFAGEVTVYDQITKVEYNCSGIYTKSPIVKMIKSCFPGITTICPNKKQSNWVNIFGVETAFKFKITKDFFTKLGIFCTFPCNIFKKIQPIDLKLQSCGVGLSFGYTF